MRDLGVILEVVRAISVHRERKALFAAVSQAMRRILPADWVVLSLIGEEEFQILHVDPPLPPDFELPSTRVTDFIGKGVDRTAVSVHTREDVAPFPMQAELMRAFDVHRIVRLPLVVEERPVGVMAMWCKDPAAVDGLDLDLLVEAARAVALVVDACEAFEKVRRLRDEAAADNARLLDDMRGRVKWGDVIGDCVAFRAIKDKVHQVGPTGTTVLLTGETGTGKDRVARAIHDASPRRDHPMVNLNCAALPTNLVESELFGHEQGAFTGARARRKGRFELAHGGTIFLDEVGELPLDTQAKLLRVLQERRFERVGGHETLEVDVRVIAATNRDLPALVEARRFRQDLYYRLAVFPIELPPLRERRADVPMLVDFFLERASARHRRPKLRVTDAAMSRLVGYAWPGNVRELQNVIERATIVSTGEVLELDGILPRAVPVRAAGSPAPVASRLDDGEERDRYHAALSATNWRIEGPAGAAARLGIHPNTLRYRLKRLGLERPR